MICRSPFWILVFFFLFEESYAHKIPGQHCNGRYECYGHSFGEAAPIFTVCHNEVCCYHNVGVFCNFKEECCYNRNCEKNTCCEGLGKQCKNNFECCNNDLPANDMELIQCQNTCCHVNIGSTCYKDTDCCQQPDSSPMRCYNHLNICCVDINSTCTKDIDCCPEEKTNYPLTCHPETKKCCNSRIGARCDEDDGICCDSLLNPSDVNYTECRSIDNEDDSYTYCIRMNYGAKCTKNWHCKSGNCIENICVGQVGDNCSEDKDCFQNTKYHSICNKDTKKCCKSKLKANCERHADDDDDVDNHNYIVLMKGYEPCLNDRDCLSNTCSNNLCCSQTGDYCTADFHCCHNINPNTLKSSYCNTLTQQCCVYNLGAACSKDSDCCYNSMKEPTDLEYMKCSEDSKCTYVNQGSSCNSDGECFNQHCNKAGGVCCNAGVGFSCSNDHECCDSVLMFNDTSHVQCNNDTKICCHHNVNASCESNTDCCKSNLSPLNENYQLCSANKTCCIGNLGAPCNENGECCGFYIGKNTTEHILCHYVGDYINYVDYVGYEIKRCCSLRNGRCNTNNDCCNSGNRTKVNCFDGQFISD